MPPASTSSPLRPPWARRRLPRCTPLEARACGLHALAMAAVRRISARMSALKARYRRRQYGRAPQCSLSAVPCTGSSVPLPTQPARHARPPLPRASAAPRISSPQPAGPVRSPRPRDRRYVSARYQTRCAAPRRACSRRHRCWTCPPRVCRSGCAPLRYSAACAPSRSTRAPMQRGTATPHRGPRPAASGVGQRPDVGAQRRASRRATRHPAPARRRLWLRWRRRCQTACATSSSAVRRTAGHHRRRQQRRAMPIAKLSHPLHRAGVTGHAVWRIIAAQNGLNPAIAQSAHGRHQQATQLPSR